MSWSAFAKARSGRSTKSIGKRVAAEDRRQLARRLVDRGGEVERDDRSRVRRQHAQAGEDRVDRLVEPVDLLQRGCAPKPAASAASGSTASRRRAAPPSSSTYARTTASGVRSACVTTATRLARASSIARRLSIWASASRCSRLRSTMPASSAGERLEERDVAAGEARAAARSGR